MGKWDAPSRGHDLKLQGGDPTALSVRDAPSRGHDLKLFKCENVGDVVAMPPHGGMT